ncbi:MAG TPA: histidinol dehydrogenase, partial [Flavobacteriaceae bacterium]|nr:histidinol dehydrogenase [Flavobacteriaceae bacterium]
MQTYINPNISDWSTLTARPTKEVQDLQKIVLDVFGKIQTEKNQALIDFTEQFDKVKLSSLEVTAVEIEEAKTLISEELKQAIQLAASNIEKFHSVQREEVQIIETTNGVNCWRESRAIENVGIYIPGGTAPLFSTTLMLGIPAKLAGCQNIILCTPPNKEGKIHPAILYTANLIGIEKIHKVGGIQAIGTLTF